MSAAPHRPDDPYSRVNYRRLIAWEKRIAREGPFLRSLLGRAPERSVIDIGCGTGEHVAFFSAAGARAVGLDRSEAMLKEATARLRHHLWPESSVVEHRRETDAIVSGRTTRTAHEPGLSSATWSSTSSVRTARLNGFDDRRSTQVAAPLRGGLKWRIFGI